MKHPKGRSNRSAAPFEEDALRSFRMRHASAELLVFSSSLGPEPSLRLTPAQLEVASAVARGKSNAAIARARGTSVRTVANQLSAIFARLGVGSREQLAAAMSRAPPEGDSGAGSP